ncbi:MAG: ABC transporter permease [Muribaculaceae bacterium]|nr:ABC transporter permease [Muribaculaceae bacterium]
MAVSLTLMAIVSSIMLSFKTPPLLNQPYSDKVEQFTRDENSPIISQNDRDLIMGHQFKSVKEMHINSSSLCTMTVSANPSGKEEHSMIAYGGLSDPEYLKFLGEKSIYSGEKLGEFKSNEVVITDWLAEKLFEGESPIGQTISLKTPFFRDFTGLDEGIYIVKDVIERPSSNNEFIYPSQHIFLFTENFTPFSYSQLYLLLREGADREELQTELENLLSNNEFVLLHVKDKYDESKYELIRKCIILFMFIFVLVSFSNYLRQQMQLFRLREREVALRTCVGSQPASLFWLFATEILIVLISTLVLALTLIFIVVGFLNSNYHTLIEENTYNFDDSYPVAFISAAILLSIGMIVATITVRRIRRDQTGLALRMKPRPKHRLRNVGLTVQMTISILFLWLTSLYFLSIDSIKDMYGIPEDVDRYKRALNILKLSSDPENSSKVLTRIDSLDCVERVFKLSVDGFTVFDPDEEFPNTSYYSELFQNSEDIEDFFGLEINELPGKVNPDRYVLISEDFKKMLIDKNLWNGKTVTLPNRANGEYEIKGVFDKIPFKENFNSKAVIITDRHAQRNQYGVEFSRFILPKAGKQSEAKSTIDNIIREEVPNRVDIMTDSYFNLYAPRGYSMASAVITIIYVLSIISLITTIAAVYSGVSLDTRRRRKEMALRKLNGATRKVIALIFLRTYIVIIAAAAVIALPLGLIGIPKLVELDIAFEVYTTSIVPPYLFTVLLIIAVTAVTIVWKIRDIMHADPIEYLKE